MKTQLVTGGAGFIGSNYCHYLSKIDSSDKVIILDKLTYAGSLNNLKELDKSKFIFIKGDIADPKCVSDVFNQYQIDSVIHFAAESHVDNSIHSPGVFVQTNVLGTFNLLESARQYWGNSATNRFHHVSTDEVYGALGPTGFFDEQTKYQPNSPYSASKASSDMLVRSYGKTYGMNVVTTNCSNNFGERQHSEKLIPTIISKALKQEDIPIYGKGENIRDWLYVQDHCEALHLVFNRGTPQQVYNIGGENEINNLDLAKQICEILDQLQPLKGGSSYKKLITFVEDRPGHDFRYAIKLGRIKDELEWNPKFNFEEALKKSIQWFLAHEQKERI